MLEEGRRRVALAAATRKIRLQEGDARSLPFEDGQFDALTFTYLLRYVEDPAGDAARARARRASPAARSPGSSSASRAASGGRSGSSGRASGCPAAGPADRRRLARGRLVPRTRRSASTTTAWPLPRLLDGVARRGHRGRAGAAAEPRRRGGDVGTQEEVRPAFYALAPRRLARLRDAAAPAVHALASLVRRASAPRSRRTSTSTGCCWALAAFFLAMGVAAHALDELNGRPLRTRDPGPALVALAVVSLAGAVAIGIGAACAWGCGLLAFIAVGAVARARVQPRARVPQRRRLRARLGRVSRR